MPKVVHTFEEVFASVDRIVSEKQYLSASDESNSTERLNPFEQAELIRLLKMEFRNLASVQVKSVLGYDQQYWRNPASVHVIQPEDITQFGYANTVEALQGSGYACQPWVWLMTILHP